MEMTSRERVLCAMSAGQPDMVPIFDFIYSRKLYQEVLGRVPTYYNGEDALLCAAKIGYDLGAVPLGGLGGVRNYDEQKAVYQDEWGTTYKQDEKYSWPADAPVEFPVQNLDDWRNYAMPDPNKPGRLKEIEAALKVANEHRMAVFGIVRGPFTAAWLLLGLDKFCMKLYQDPDLVDQVVAACTDFYIQGGLNMIKAGVHAIAFADDYGSINGPFMSPNHFAKHILPHLSRMVAAFKKAGVPVMMHSDGNIKLLLDQIITTGINSYHPVERAAGMDLAQIKSAYGQRLCCMGNVNNKTTLVSGGVDDVRAEVLQCLRQGAPGGGYMLCSDHSLKDDVPNENVFALYETGRKYGKYPFDPASLPV